MIDHYLPDIESRAHPYASPLFARDLSGVASAYVMNAEHDPRRDECEAYVVRLRDAGVKAGARMMAGHIHGSLALRDWEPARTWQRHVNELLHHVQAEAVFGSSAGDWDVSQAP